MGRTCASLILFALLGAVFGQQTPLAFEMASIRPTTHPQDRGCDTSISGNRFTFTNCDVFFLTNFAYDTGGFHQFLGGPSWMRSEKFDITAKAAGEGNRDLNEDRAMVQSLLADRFKLVVHREMRELPVYALIVAKNGPKFMEANDGPSGYRGTRGHFAGPRTTMASLAGYLRSDVRTFVFDETGLTGEYAITLDWNPDETELGAGDSSRPSLFTALQEQLGLKLEPVKRPVEHIVIDQVEKPTEN